MTMFSLPNFCRVCLKYDKNLIDLAHIENEPSETLMSKLQLCVSEVEWTAFKPLLCHPCIKRLNIAYGFKKQCIQSGGVLKNYVELVKESQKKHESQTTGKNENTIPQGGGGGAYMLLPNQKYVKILVGPQNQTTANTFQNVFLNLIPATSLNSVVSPQPVTPTTTTSNIPKGKDSNQNVFLNLNNTFQKFIPINSPAAAPAPPPPPTINPTVSPPITVDVSPKKTSYLPKPIAPSVNVNQLLTESKSEEVSVEIDPTIFGLEAEEESNDEEEINDYDEVISSAKITLKDFKTNGEQIQNGKEELKHFVPILPKQDDFISSGQHFLFSSAEPAGGGFVCEHCQKSFSTKKILKVHINHFHLGKMPFKCEYCYMDFATRSDYENCLKNHRSESDALNTSLTLEDFVNNSSDSSQIEIEANIEPTENGIYVCDVCNRPFNSSTGLLRHKVRKHNQKNKKKYFIKGMKNARCDICNREFSTQSYLQLHRKLHLRDDIGYKYKVFGKSKYGDLDMKEDKYVDKEDDKKGMILKKEMANISDIDQTEKRVTENHSPSSIDYEQQIELSASDNVEHINEEITLEDLKMEVEDEDDNSEHDEIYTQDDDKQDTEDETSEENN